MDLACQVDGMDSVQKTLCGAAPQNPREMVEPMLNHSKLWSQPLGECLPPGLVALINSPACPWPLPEIERVHSLAGLRAACNFIVLFCFDLSPQEQFLKCRSIPEEKGSQR